MKKKKIKQLKKIKQKQMISNTFELQVEGLNVEKLLNAIADSGITISQVERVTYKKLTFLISHKDYEKACRLKLFSGFTIHKNQEFGFRAFVNHFLRHIGVYVGTVAGVLCFVVLSQFTFNINIMGTDKINKQEILQELKNLGIETGKINRISKDLEQTLKSKFEDISLISVVQKGTNLIINIKEKIDNGEDELSAIIAPANLVITKMDVKQGIAIKKVGDVVRIGEEIVLPYMLNSSGVQVPCDPIASIECDVWYSGKVEFDTEKIEYIKTGKKIVNSYYEMFGAKFFETKKDVPFEKYEDVVYNDYVFNNFFLPVKMVKTTYYELKEKRVMQNYEKNKDKLEKESKSLAYKNLPAGLEVVEENLVTSTVGTKYIICTYLKCHITI